MTRSLNLNNTEDIIADSISLIQGNNAVNIFDLFEPQGSTNNNIDTLIGQGAVVITGSGTSRTIDVDLSPYYTATQIGILLSGKVSSVNAGTGISITGISTAPVINADTQLTIQRDASTQSQIDTLNISSAISSISGGTMTISAPIFQPSVNLGTTSSNTLVLTRNNNDLTWNGATLATQSWVTSQGGGGSSLTLKANGVTQTANTLDILSLETTLSNNTLSIGPPKTTRVGLYYASTADSKNLEQTATGDVSWNGLTLATQTWANTALNLKQTIDAAQTRVRLGTSSAFKDLTKSGTGSLVWGTNNIVEEPTLVALENYTIAQLATKQNTLTAGANITISNNTISASGGSGSALEVAVNGTVQSGATRLDFLANEAVFSGTTLLVGPPLTTRVGLWYASVVDRKDLERGSSGELKWGGAEVAMAADISNYSENQGSETTILQSFDTATPSTHISWTHTGGVSNTAGSHQTMNPSLVVLSNTSVNGPAGGTIFMEVYMRAGTANGTIISINNSTTWTGFQELVVSGLSTTSFTRVQGTFTLPSNRIMSFHIGYTPSGSSSTAPPGTIDIRNLRIWRTSKLTTIQSNMDVLGSMNATGSVTGQAFTSTSDGRFKDDVAPLDTTECLQIAQALIPCKYVRTDLGEEVDSNDGRRVGFIAQQVQETIPNTWTNIVATNPFNGSLTLDYSKLTPILCCAIQALADKVSDLEAKLQ